MSGCQSGFTSCLRTSFQQGTQRDMIGNIKMNVTEYHESNLGFSFYSFPLNEMWSTIYHWPWISQTCSRNRSLGADCFQTFSSLIICRKQNIKEWENPSAKRSRYKTGPAVIVDYEYLASITLGILIIWTFWWKWLEIHILTSMS